MRLATHNFRYFTTLVLLGLFTSLDAQTYFVEYDEYTNRYEGENDTEFKSMLGDDYEKLNNFLNTPEHYRLTYCNGISVFKNYLKEGEDEEKTFTMSEGDKSMMLKFSRTADDDEWYKNFNTSENIMNLYIMQKPFLIKEALLPLDWKLSEETKKIGEFECIKATAMDGDNEITAYYTEDIPIPDGPKDYFGLPGLIVDLLVNGEPKYSLTTLQIINEETKINAPTKGKVLSMEEYDKIYEEKKRQSKDQFFMH